MDIEFRSEYLGLPGYMAFGRALSRAAGNPLAAWADLHIFDYTTVEEFLRQPIKAVAARIRDGTFIEEDLTELAALFAMLAIHADREMRGEEARPPEPTTKPNEENDDGKDSVSF